uniref:Uncharacterized protein n=1 Tax=Anguilla anguilla TaxID=7936 RepID=A0A0E9Q463_ANGAN
MQKQCYYFRDKILWGARF